MEVHIKANPGECYAVYVNGEIAVEGLAGTFETGESIIEEIRAARANNALRNLVRSAVKESEKCERIPVEKMSPAKKRDAWARGLRDGLAGLSVPHPDYGVPDLPPEETRPYLYGYEMGDALRRASGLAGKLDLEGITDA